jgi:uridine kinase
MMIVGLAGGTGSGKSSIVRSLVERIGGCVIDLESYTLDRSADPPEERSAIGDDEPAAIDTTLLVAHLEDLRRGEAIHRPVYSPETHARTGVAMVAPARLVLVEGLFTLWWESLRSPLDVKVFVDAPADLRLIRRLRRDLADRGRTVEQVLYQYSGSVPRTSGTSSRPAFTPTMSSPTTGRSKTPSTRSSRSCAAAGSTGWPPPVSASR